MSPRRSASPAGLPVELAALPPIAPAASATEERRERELEDLIAEIGTDGKIHVFNDGKFAGVMTLADCSLESLLDQYGGGDKSLVVYQGGKKAGTVRVSLDPDIPATSPRQRKLQEATAKAGNATAPATKFDDMILLMLKTQMDGARNVQDMMTGMVTAMTAVLNATASRQPASDPLDAALKVAAILKENRAETNPVDMFTIFEKGIGMGKQITGGTDDDGTNALIGKGLDVLHSVTEAAGKTAEARAVEARAAQLAVVAPVRTVPALSAPTAPPPEAGQPRPDQGGAGAVVGTHDGGVGGGAPAPAVAGGAAPGDARPWVKAAGHSMSMLQSAAAWMTPARAADAIVDRMDDEAFSDLIDDMEAPGFGERLIAEYPEVRMVPREWLEQLITDLLSMVQRTDGMELGASMEQAGPEDGVPPVK